MPDLTPLVQPVYNLAVMQKVTVSGTHAETTNAVAANAILVISTTACHIVIGDSPVATANDQYIPANVPMAFACQGSNKVSVIQDAAGGSLFVTGLN